MKRILNSAGRLITLRLLVLLLLILVGLLIAGTIFAFVRKSDAAPLLRISNSAQPGVIQELPVKNNVSVFTGIGRLRIPLKNSATLILSIAFPYPADDRAFTEELAMRIGEFRSIAGDYFSSLNSDKLSIIDEEAAKNEILKRYNSILLLGKLDVLFFNDLILLE